MLTYLRGCCAIVVAFGMSIEVQSLIFPHYYQMRWSICGLLVRIVGCMIGAITARFVWPSGRCLIVTGLAIASLGMDIWSVASFHFRQALEEYAAGWMETPWTSKLDWIAMYSFASILGASIGQAVGAAMRNWIVKIYRD